MFGLTPAELSIFKKLSTPQKIQDYLDTLPRNFEKKGQTCYSARMVLREQKAHCVEGAFFAAAALHIHGEKPLLMDFQTTPEDEDHVVALFQQNGYWGAISKTNHPVLRYRDPIYKTPRELALTYFHEYFMVNNGKKTLRAYSKPFSLLPYVPEFIISEKRLWDLVEELDDSPHFPLVPKANMRLLRPASKIERDAFYLSEWTKEDPRT
ncbi:hypothetical protein K8Q93_00530 [Candidatus Parcubacteria bacterium]|nr:hypothetical protein [Candidatus Parcubacteria bacterium]